MVINGFLFFAQKVFAVDAGVLGAYPSNFDSKNPKTKSWFIYELKPGETKEDSITVVNNSDRSLDVKVYPVDATTTSDGAFALLNEDQRQNGVGSWVNIAKDTINIKPRDHMEVPFTITIPKYATVGDHAGGIIVQEITKPSTEVEGMGLNIVSRVGTRIYETVPGAKIVSLDLRDLQYKIVDKNLEFSFILENKGNVILTPTGNLEVKGTSGKSIEVISLGNLGSVFPGKPTRLTVKSNKQAPWFGQYTATITLNYSPTKALSKSLTFFIYIRDWTLALPVPIILLLLVFFIIAKKIFIHAHGLKQLKQTIITPIQPSPAMTRSIQPQPAIATVPIQNVDQLFIAHHIKLLVVLISIGILLLSSLFAFVLQYFVLSRTSVDASQIPIQRLQPTPTEAPTPTNIPFDKSEIEVAVLNGSGKTGEAKSVANKLVKDGFTVIKIDNAPQNEDQTIIQYPEGKLREANALMDALISDYSNIKRQEASGSSQFTIILGM